MTLSKLKKYRSLLMKCKLLKNVLVMFSIVLFVFLIYRYVYDGTIEVKSTFDNKHYKVRSGKDTIQKANLLAILNTKLNIIVDSLNNNTTLNKNENVKRLVANWKRGVSIKEIGKMENDAAYVINKKHLSFCLQQKPDNDKIITDVNLMTYVGIHELAHIMSMEIGHGQEFIDNFQFLLNYSKDLKYFDPVTKTNLPLYVQLNKVDTADNYCGVPLVNSIK